MNSLTPLAFSLANLGLTEIVLILLIILLLFGGRKLPELARAIGKSLREFRKGQQDAEAESDKDKEPKGKE